MLASVLNKPKYKITKNCTLTIQLAEWMYNNSLIFCFLVPTA